jgi:ribosome maturation protein Sdo1
MINRGHSLYKISRTLRVSPSTAARLESAMDQGMFKTLLAKATKGKLEKALEELITFIAIPLTTPYKGAKGIKLNFD